MLDAAGALLAGSTAALCAAVVDEAPGAVTHLLVYLPTVLDPEAPEAKRANVPVGWASPAFDVLQLEDYDWVTEGRSALTARGVAAMTAGLGYPVAEQHYFSGFVLNAEDRAQWGRIAAAADAARGRGVAASFIWALPQICRDGFTYFRIGEEDDMDAFDDVLFPLALGREASVAPVFSTQVVESQAGHEQRSSDWADARMRYDAGPGVRSEADLAALIAFFRARRGAAMLVQAQANSATLSDPPASPLPGECWIVGDTPSGAWAGQSGTLACWSEGGWRFVAPQAGMPVRVEDEGIDYLHDGEGWHKDALRPDGLYISGVRIVGVREAAISPPSGGTVIDSEARATILAILNALENHGLVEETE